MPLSADEMADLTDEYTDELTATATIHNVTYAPSPSGGRTRTVGAILRTVAAKVGTRTVMQQGQGGALVAVTQMVVALPSDDPILTAQVIKVAGVEYDVLSVDDGGTGEIGKHAVVRRAGG